VICTHTAAAITDHAQQGVDGGAIRYAWRGACSACHKGVVGATTLPAELDPERLTALLTRQLTSYFSRAASAGV